jgi:hypothetical protein
MRVELLNKTGRVLKYQTSMSSGLDVEANTDIVAHSIRKKIGYDGSYIYHIDDYAINQSKIYCGLPTLCFDHQHIVGDNTISDDGWNLPLINSWCALPDSPTDIVSSITEALNKGNKEEAYAYLRLYMKKIWDHQLHAGNLLPEGERVYHCAPMPQTSI